ncbi:histidine phosphatase family protein [Azotosporobacter soli]|uniref:histidine phosphatase family protein n=1 Tax=Azotosporobacter soli TaxID=3055040 RepID=UPI0031FEDC52
MGASTKVILVRHGQTDWNRTKRYQGHSDIPLNETGQMQAKQVGKRLASLPLRAVYSSDLTRAVQTAAAIALPHGLTVMTCAAFRELNFGLWEGLTYEEIMAGWPAWLTAMYARPSIGYAPQGESFPLVQLRALKGLNACIAAHPGETIAIVSHGGPLRTLLCAALGLPIDQVWSLKQDTTAVNILEYSEGLLQLVLSNDTQHLKEDA